MSLRPFKFAVQATALELDDDGRIVGEQTGPVEQLYTVEQLRDYLERAERTFELFELEQAQQ